MKQNWPNMFLAEHIKIEVIIGSTNSYKRLSTKHKTIKVIRQKTPVQRSCNHFSTLISIYYFVISLTVYKLEVFLKSRKINT